MYFPNCKMYLSRALNVFVSEQRLNIYSLVRLVQPNTEMLISQPFTGLYKIRLLLQDCLTSRYVRFFLALLQLQLCLQLQQNTMVPVDVDGQICHFCSQGFVP